MNHAIKNIPANLYRLRIRKNMPQADLAAKLGVTRGYISAVECGTKTPSLARVLEIARVFDTSPNELLKGSR